MTGTTNRCCRLNENPSESRSTPEPRCGAPIGGLNSGPPPIRDQVSLTGPAPYSMPTSLEIHLNRIHHNASTLVGRLTLRRINIIVATQVALALPKLSRTMCKAGATSNWGRPHSQEGRGKPTDPLHGRVGRSAGGHSAHRLPSFVDKILRLPNIILLNIEKNSVCQGEASPLPEEHWGLCRGWPTPWH